jgi:hypothetical protein
VLYDEIGQALSGQHDYVEELNGRAQQLFGFAAVILTVLAGLVPGQSSTFGKVLDLIAVPLFVMAAFFSAKAWDFRLWRSDPDVTQLWENYQLKSEEYLRHQVIQNRLDCLKANEEPLKRKLRQIKTAQVSLYVGFVYLVGLLLYRVFVQSASPEHSEHFRHAVGLLFAYGRQAF